MPNELVPPSLAAASSRDTCCVVYKTARDGSSEPRETLLVEITGFYGHDDSFQWGQPCPLENRIPSLENPDVFAVSYDRSQVHRHLFYGKPEGDLLEIHTLDTTSGVWGTPAKLLYSDGIQVLARKDSKLAAGVWKRALHLFFVDADHTLVDIVGTQAEAGGPYSWTRSNVSVAPRIMRGSFLALSLNGHALTVIYQYWDGTLCSSEASYETWTLRRLLQKTEIDPISPLAITGSRTIFYVLTIAGQTMLFARDIGTGGDRRIGLATQLGNHAAGYHIAAVNIGQIQDARVLAVTCVDGKHRLVERMEINHCGWTGESGLVVTCHLSTNNDGE